jgi:hypothetical protein
MHLVWQESNGRIFRPNQIKATVKLCMKSDIIITKGLHAVAKTWDNVICMKDLPWKLVDRVFIWLTQMTFIKRA